jgi:hypothetical protein
LAELTIHPADGAKGTKPNLDRDFNPVTAILLSGSLYRVFSKVF